MFVKRKYCMHLGGSAVYVSDSRTGWVPRRRLLCALCTVYVLQE
jgi:hypothetical protein